MMPFSSSTTYIASVQAQRYHALVSNCQHLQTKVHIVIVDLNITSGTPISTGP